MEKILLAIDGIAPDSRIISFAVSLCKRMRAGLDVLHILGPQYGGKYLKNVKQSARHTRNLIEDAMVAATFVETRQQEISEQLRTHLSAKLKHLFPERESDGIEYQLTLKSGNPDEEIVRYVHDHRDVVLTIYVPAGTAAERGSDPGNKKDTVRQIGQKLATPLVIMREM
jgi:hypothetical protein